MPRDEKEQDPKQMVSEIEDMLSATGGPLPPAETKPEVEPQVEPKVEVKEPDVKEPELEVKEPETVVEVKEPVVEETVETPSEPSADDLKKQLASYEDQMSKLRTAFEKMSEPMAASVSAPGPEKTPAELVADFVTSDEEFDEMFRSRAKFNEVMARAITKADAVISERVYGKVTPAIQRMVAYQTTAQERANTFFRENSDLIPYRNFVVFTSRGLETAHPEWDATTLLTEVEKEVRTTIGLTKQPGGPVVTQPANRATVVRKVDRAPVTSGGGTRDTKPKMSALEEEFAAIVPSNVKLPFA